VATGAKWTKIEIALNGPASHGAAENKIRYLKFRDGPYWLKAGCDDPENFLGKYKNFDTLAKRKAAIDYLAERGIHNVNAPNNDYIDAPQIDFTAIQTGSPGTRTAALGLRRTEFNFAGTCLVTSRHPLTGKIEFCTSEPERSSEHPV
jgi:hypothetical protein